ncbi:hypothetical protein KIN20_004953 [Parelaphostrongylus tenuis]|uniref:Uncharacterized protein n=1 Tax=Parelaphostrongylus tenuis TaxID=148309 RepID=A0AAD5QFK5_PARTN|nr:hypothetical protein KIN20_004953 [Parelaphostrongylus tenuis]
MARPFGTTSKCSTTSKFHQTQIMTICQTTHFDVQLMAEFDLLEPNICPDRDRDQVNPSVLIRRHALSKINVVQLVLQHLMTNFNAAVMADQDIKSEEKARTNKRPQGGLIISPASAH